MSVPGDTLVNPQLAQAWDDLHTMEKDRDRWRRALNDCTPGGSEFARDPNYCVEWVKKARHNLWESNKKFVLENRRLREILADSIKAFRLIRDGAEGTEIRTLARDLVNQLEELNVGKGNSAQATEPKPREASFNIARKESD